MPVVASQFLIMKRARTLSVLIALALSSGCLGKPGVATAADTTLSHGGTAPVAIYGLLTDKLTKLQPNHLEYSEGIFLQYPVSVDLDAFKLGLTVTPPTAVSVVFPFVNLSNMKPRPFIPRAGGPTIFLRALPGQTYRIEQPAFGLALNVTTSPLSIDKIPEPIRHVTNSPYYYGILDHPFGGFLGGLVYSKFTKKISDAQQLQVDDARRTVRAIADSGAGFVRMDFCGDQSIGHLTPYPAAKFERYDAIVEELAAVHVTVLPEILQNCAPLYLVNSDGRTYATPENYATWAAAVAEHLKRFPQITRVELFNEPNLRGGWRPGSTSPYAGRGNGDVLAPFMKAGYAAVKAANPSLMVVSGAFAAGGNHVDPRVVLDKAYEAGCRTGVCWDEISVHNYRWSSPVIATIASDQHDDNRFDIYKDLQEIALNHGDVKPKIMLTEWGYSTCEKQTQCFNPLVQALYVAQGLNLALADPTIDGIVYVNIHTPVRAIPNFWDETGLLESDYSKKPAFTIFQKFAKGSHS